MSDPAARPGAFRVSGLSSKRPNPFDLRPDDAARAALADRLNLLGLRKLRFAGQISAEGKSGWRLEAILGATVVQPCVTSLEPVTTRIDEPVTRRFLPAALIQTDPDADEAEMPEDDSVEPLGDVIDTATVMQEALALALPLYPRADGANFGDAQYAEDGVTPMTDDDAKPFAGLAGLRDKLGPKD